MSTLELEHLKHTSSSSNNLSVHSDGSLTATTLTIGDLTVNNKLGVGSVPNATFGSLLYAQGTPAANKPIISGYSQGNSNNAGLALFNDSGNRGIWTGPGSSMRFTRSYEGNSAVDMNIDSSGRVTMPNQPAFKVAYGSRNATGTDRVISTNAGDTFLTIRDIYDTGNNFDEATGRFTAPVAGTYVFVSQLMRYASNGTVLENRIKKNGVIMWARAYASAYTSSYQSSTIATTTKMNAGDYVENFIQGTSSIYNDDSYFTGYLLG